jgi:hypothetical protein
MALNLTAYLDLTEPVTFGELTQFVEAGRAMGVSPDDEIEMVYGAGEGQVEREFSGLSLVGDPDAVGAATAPVSVDRATIDRLIGLINAIEGQDGDARRVLGDVRHELIGLLAGRSE